LSRNAAITDLINTTDRISHMTISNK